MRKEYIKITVDNKIVQPIAVYSGDEVDSVELLKNEKFIKVIELSLVNIDLYLRVLNIIKD